MTHPYRPAATQGAAGGPAMGHHRTRHPRAARHPQTTRPTARNRSEPHPQPPGRRPTHRYPHTTPTTRRGPGHCQRAAPAHHSPPHTGPADQDLDRTLNAPHHRNAHAHRAAPSHTSRLSEPQAHNRLPTSDTARCNDRHGHPGTPTTARRNETHPTGPLPSATRPHHNRPIARETPTHDHTTNTPASTPD